MTTMTVTDKLQRVLNAAARVITGTRKFGRGLGHVTVVTRVVGFPDFLCVV